MNIYFIFNLSLLLGAATILPINRCGHSMTVFMFSPAFGTGSVNVLRAGKFVSCSGLDIERI